MKSGIYQIKNTVNGKRYIGSAVNIKMRFQEHKKSLKKGTNSKRLQHSWNKHGADSFGRVAWNKGISSRNKGIKLSDETNSIKFAGRSFIRRKSWPSNC